MAAWTHLGPGLRLRLEIGAPGVELESSAREDPDLRLPSRRAANDLLKREGLVRRRVRPRKPGHPGKPTTIATAANQIWCVDFKGQFKTLDGRYCYPLTVTDAYSRFIIACRALPSIESATVQTIFLQLFRRFGLPDAIKSDNGVPFASTALGRLSQLSVLWIRLGIRPLLIQPGKPKDLTPSCEALVRRHQDRSALVAARHELKEEVCAEPLDREVSDLVELCGAPHKWTRSAT